MCARGKGRRVKAVRAPHSSCSGCASGIVRTQDDYCTEVLCTVVRGPGARDVDGRVWQDGGMPLRPLPSSYMGGGHGL
jgi:hypothetical protein